MRRFEFIGTVVIDFSILLIGSGISIQFRGRQAISLVQMIGQANTNHLADRIDRPDQLER